VSDCEDNQIEHLGINEPNYFMYWWAWPWKQSYSSRPWLFKL